MCKWNADDADNADHRGWKSKMIRVNPHYPRHPRSITPYTEMKEP
jgi:hypothetical protein